MATVINNPPSDNSGGPFMMIIFVLVLIVLGYLAYVYGIPALRQVNVGTPQINVPSTIDVNVKQSE